MLNGAIKMQKLTIKQRFGLILFGIFLCLVVLEIGLRLGGFVMLSLQEHENKLVFNKKSTYKIMCLGGSTTADGLQYSYPSQLERILNKNNAGTRFKVINKGVDSFDSTAILSNLQKNLAKYKPDMVMVMTGENDGLDMVPYDDTLGLKVKLFFQGFRTYKIIRLLGLRIVNKVKELGFLERKKEIKVLKNKSKFVQRRYLNLMKKNSRGTGGTIGEENRMGWKKKEVEDLISIFSINKSQMKNFEVADRALKRAIEISPRELSLYSFLGDSYVCQGRYKEAEDLLKKAIAIEPNKSYLHVTLAFCYGWGQERYDEAEKELKKAIELNPQEHRAYSDLAYYYEKQEKYKQLQELCESIIISGLEDDFFYGFIATYYIMQVNQKKADMYIRKLSRFRLKYYNASTRRNYRKIKELVIQRGIKLVCVQHPMRSLEPLKKLLGSSEGVVFVDNENIFKKAVSNSKYGDYFRDCFGGDFGHCTPRGNGLLAENIAKVILKEIFNK